MHAVTKV